MPADETTSSEEESSYEESSADDSEETASDEVDEEEEELARSARGTVHLCEPRRPTHLTAFGEGTRVACVRGYERCVRASVSIS